MKIIFIVIAIVTYVINLFQVLAALSQTLTVLLALKVLGIGVPPIGIIMGIASML